MTNLESAWPHVNLSSLPDASTARVVHPLSSPRLKGHCPFENVDVAEILRKKAAANKALLRKEYQERKERKDSLKVARAAERRTRIVEYIVSRNGAWIEGKRIGRDLSIDQHTLYADLAVIRKTHLVEFQQCRRPDNRGNYMAYRGIA